MLRSSAWRSLLLGLAASAAAQEGSKLRPAQCAGDWYPRAPADLREQINELLTRAAPPALPGKPCAIIAPHAGYRFAAPVAVAGYACLRGQGYQRVIVLAFSHRNAGRYDGIDVPKDLTAFATPLGDVPIDRAACDQLLTNSLFGSTPGVDAGEHSLELQLPYLQCVLKDFKLVPLLIGRMSDRDFAPAARALRACIDGDTLLVASTDFTHYGPNFGYVPFDSDVESKLRALAEQATQPILRCDYDGFANHLAKTKDTICGRGPVQLLLRILAMRGGAQALRTGFDTSGHLTNDWTNSVTYQSFVFTSRAGKLQAAERAELLRIARQAVAAQVQHVALPNLDRATLPAKLTDQGACFVTLQNHGALRGCIGNMVAEGPLCDAVVHNAVAACQDYRFADNPVTAKELDQLDIEISYLTPMQRVTSFDEIVIGQHGLLISLGGQRGVLLPQVAYERGWSREEFLTQVCRKAGLPGDAWKRPEARLDLFEAEVFGEK